jgi:hypothetical protein
MSEVKSAKKFKANHGGSIAVPLTVPAASVFKRIAGEYYAAVYANSTAASTLTLPTELQDVLTYVAKTSSCAGLEWPVLRDLLKARILSVNSLMDGETEELLDGETFSDRLVRVLGELGKWQRPCFTLQRLCEILIAPTAHYKTRSKRFRAISKCILGISVKNTEVVQTENEN